jgi:2-polyprenyl-6-hydroxyphenyl methylase/3-demethylubiquinone-9 3-methyltransferase
MSSVLLPQAKATQAHVYRLQRGLGLQRGFISTRNSSSTRHDDAVAVAGGKDHDFSSANWDQKSVSNISPGEVDKFSSFASSWWNARSNPLVGMNPVRVKFITAIVDAFQQSPHGPELDTNCHLPLQNKRILDVACGGGLLSESLSRLGASLVVGVDASPRVVEVAETHSFHHNSRLAWQQQQQQSMYSDASTRNIRYIGGYTVEEMASQWLSKRKNEITATFPPTTNNQIADGEHELFDIITALEVIEHVPNPASLLHAAKSLLKPNGILFVSTINRTIKSYGLAIIAAEYILGKVPIGTHDWNQFRCPEEVERMVCDNGNDLGMKQIALSGMVINPPFVNMNWSLNQLDTDVNWIGAYQKQNFLQCSEDLNPKRE